MSGYPPAMRYALVAVILATATVAHAEALPPPVRAAVADAKSSCQPNRTKVGPGFLPRLDRNGDGVPDFVLRERLWRALVVGASTAALRHA